MNKVGIKNLSSYIRKMAIDGYIIKQDFKLLKEYLVELNRIGNNINQIAKIANSYGDVYHTDLQEIKNQLNELSKKLGVD